MQSILLTAATEVCMTVLGQHTVDEMCLQSIEQLR